MVFQNYLVFISANTYNEFVIKIQKKYWWKSKGMLEQSIKNALGSKNIFPLSLTDNHLLPPAKFTWNCLRMSSISLH